MTEEKDETQLQPESQPEVQPVVKRTNPKGVIVAFIVVALFLGAMCGYFGGYVAGRANSERVFQNGRGGYMMQPDGQNSPWGSYGPGMMQDTDNSPSSRSGSST